MYECIIFDVDGTMIDTGEAVFLSYQKTIYDEFGRYFTEDEIKAAFAVPTREALKKLGFKDIEAALATYHNYLMEAFCQVKPFEGIPEVLEALRNKGIKVGVVTSRNRGEVIDDICLQSLMSYFSFVVCSDDTRNHKPDPEPMLKLIELANVGVSKTLYIGDTYYDYMCAVNAGVDFALALWGARNSDNINAKYNLKDPGDILNYENFG